MASKCIRCSRASDIPSNWFIPTSGDPLLRHRYLIVFITWCLLRLVIPGFFFRKMFTPLLLMIENRLCQRISTLRNDGGGEYMSNDFKEYLRSYGIHHQRSCPYTPEQNGVAERKHWHITEVGMALMFHSHTPRGLWTGSHRSLPYQPAAY